MRLHLEDIGSEEKQVQKQVETKLAAFDCPLCFAALSEHPNGPATLFVCAKCGFKILTTKELFSRCLRQK